MLHNLLLWIHGERRGGVCSPAEAEAEEEKFIRVGRNARCHCRQRRMMLGMNLVVLSDTETQDIRIRT